MRSQSQAINLNLLRRPKLLGKLFYTCLGLMLSLGMIAVGSMYLFTSQNQVLKKMEIDNIIMKAEYLAKQGDTSLTQPIWEMQQELAQLDTQVTSLEEQRKSYAETLEDVYSVVPQEISVKSIELKDSKVSISCFGPDQTSATAFVQALQGTLNLGQITSWDSEVTDSNQNTKFNFQMAQGSAKYETF